MYRYIDPSSHNFENCLLPWFSHQSCWGQPLADPSAQAALRGKSWKATIFKILAGRINVSICDDGTYLVLTNIITYIPCQHAPMLILVVMSPALWSGQSSIISGLSFWSVHSSPSTTRLTTGKLTFTA